MLQCDRYCSQQYTNLYKTWILGITSWLNFRESSRQTRLFCRYNGFFKKNCKEDIKIAIGRKLRWRDSQLLHNLRPIFWHWAEARILSTLLSRISLWDFLSCFKADLGDTYWPTRYRIIERYDMIWYPIRYDERCSNTIKLVPISVPSKWLI